MTRKRKPLPPRRLRMKRAARLQAARTWLTKYTGKRVVRGYARWFGIDLGCALKELTMLGIALDPTYVEQLRETIRQRQLLGCRQRAKRCEAAEAAKLEFQRLEAECYFEFEDGEPEIASYLDDDDSGSP